jgi:hypothetical protein
LTTFNALTDGITVAYAVAGTIQQTVGVTAQSGVTYTLQVELGRRNDFENQGVIDLIVGSHVLVASGTYPSPGFWSNYTACYTATALDAGAPITISLNSTSQQGDWDNVRLSSSVPEPSTWAMMLLGFAGVGLATYRRKNKTTLNAV